MFSINVVKLCDIGSIKDYALMLELDSTELQFLWACPVPSCLMVQPLPFSGQSSNEHRLSIAHSHITSTAESRMLASEPRLSTAEYPISTSGPVCRLQNTPFRLQGRLQSAESQYQLRLRMSTAASLMWTAESPVDCGVPRVSSVPTAGV